MADTCANCGTTVGPSTKQQPSNCCGAVWCPRCFTWKHMDEDPNLNATQACAAKCVRCHWVAVSFGALPGGGAMRCGHCGEFTALKVRLEDLPVTPKEAKAQR